MSPLKVFVDILAVVGGVGMLVVMIVLLLLKVKSRRETQADKKIDEDRTLNDRLKTVEMAINSISDHSAEFRTILKDLAMEVQNIRTKCVAHQQVTMTADLKQDLKRASDRIDVISDALRTSYIQTTAHYSDLAIINNAIAALRQQTNETNNNLLTLLARNK